jgi:hypothetical protein
MVDTSWMVGTTVKTKEQIQAGTEEGPMMAAALAAVLVEYRRYLRQHEGHDGPANSGTNWQMVGRLEQLRGQA